MISKIYCGREFLSYEISEINKNSHESSFLSLSPQIRLKHDTYMRACLFTHTRDIINGFFPQFLGHALHFSS